MAPLRFGLIGTGHWALHVHGAALASSDVAQLHGVWGRDAARAADLARRLGAQGYEDLDALFADVDAVSLAVPPDAQAHLALRAARAGCHLLMEKPMALEVEAAAALAGAVGEAGVAAIIFFTGRYRPELERWTEAAAEDGPWHSAHLVHYANIFQPGNPYSSSAWRRQFGALWDVGPHALAAVLPIMGPVREVTARRGPAGSDTVHLVLSHSSPRLGPPWPSSAPGERGGASTLSLSLTMPPAATATQLTIYGERGPRQRPESSTGSMEAFKLALVELAELVSTRQRHHRCDVSFGLEVVRVLAAAQRAMELPGVAPA